MFRVIGDVMVKFISLKVVGLVCVGLLCLVGSMYLVPRGNGDGPGSATAGGASEALAEQVRALDVRLLRLETLLAEGGHSGQGDIDTMKQQIHGLQSLVVGVAKRLERHEKRVDNRAKTKDNVVKVEKRAAPRRPSVPSRSSYHVVRQGETLYRISKKYNVSEHDLIRLNGLKDRTRIYVGQRLRVSASH
ncbi:LysM domain-containing protein [Desulfoluna spongiiphila]|uniref:LysM domain-containing protein n=2 Tax=Desulfoluna spongiiphila TaxID=419481 RepID=A0A1G5J9L8_9BACT|nr:LysM domain-containing protein [Desulfoluna spongiiphila]